MATKRLATGTSLLVTVLAIGCASGARSPSGGYVPTTYNTGDVVDSSTGTDLGGAPDTSATDASAQDSSGRAADAGSPPSDTGIGPMDTAGPQDVGLSQDAGISTDTGASVSCGGKCGAKYDKTLPCQCNDQCPQYGNCCADYFAACKPEALSCKGRCDEQDDKTMPCQCGWDCSKHGNCCTDYLGQCAAGKNLTFIEAAAGECDKASDWVATQQVKDGDTFTLKAIHGGETVRFLIVNTPEIKEKQCYAIDAQKFTLARLKNSKYPGKGGYHVCLIKDSNQPDKDIYGRLLRYVYYMEPGHTKPVQLNARLVRMGYGRVFYPFAKGNKHEAISLLMQEQARKDKIGGWGSCGDWK